MNLEESDSFAEELEKNRRRKRGVMISIILCAFLVALLMFMISIIKYQDSITLKYFINGAQAKKAKIKVTHEEDTQNTYIKLEDLAKFLGYKYEIGDYVFHDEDKEKGYITNEYEVVTFGINANTYKKYNIVPNKSTLIAENKIAALSAEDDYEVFVLNEPLQFIDDSVYISVKDVSRFFSVRVDWQQYRRRFTKLDGIYTTKMVNNIIAQGYAAVDYNIENIKAALDNYVVVQNENKLFGIYNLETKKEILSCRYAEIKYSQNTQDFYVKTDKETVGLVDNKGNILVNLDEYTELKLLDQVQYAVNKDDALYLVKKDDEYGVVDRNNNVIIYPQYEKIGYDIAPYNQVDLTNPYIYFNRCIVCMKENKYAVFNLKHPRDDQELLDSRFYLGFGCRNANKSRASGTEQSVFLIPSSCGIEGIVVNYNGLYGIYDTIEGELTIPCVFDKIYYITKNGEDTYYYQYGNETGELKDYIYENGFNTVSEKKTSKVSTVEEDE